jgi:AcrR family transcriptional regulator
VTTTVPSRRDRLRAATLTEIIETARRLLVTEGHSGVTLRAISREMGMTAPALYRYFDSLDKLLERLCVSLFDECIEHIYAKMAGVDGPTERLGIACREFRRWSLDHRAEFTLMFASPADAIAQQPNEGEVYAAGMRFCAVFLTMFNEIYPFPAPADDELPLELREQLEAFRATVDTPLSVGALQVYLSHWIRLYGMVALEVFGHLGFALSDAEAMFETELAAVKRTLRSSTP